ncbi:hypothetical protein A1O3_07173 [Capronia epimyces CBS 606.96]|uniref:Zn(2)-C6 fungal-type domain-containing protein n=1 Tax=Capronia epimyces CBS 606.96 TaxID=1182542 RepID=W9XU94_9EURO|nr:uncharacterized protein A1O3_07173 [Capronia epimyces CBS 606.96]EXJ80885.1 hypothetical protein A1O3_07173 [Capronia epimyces CBS 606.96]
MASALEADPTATATATSTAAAVSRSSSRSASQAKRPRPSDAASAYPRKRTAVACELCRRKKTRCDNGQPSCRLCRVSGVVCVYSTFAENSPLISPEPTTTELLERINYVATLVESRLPTARQGSIFSPLATTSTPATSSTPGPSASAAPQARQPPIESASGDDLEVPESDGVSERMLDWPELRGFSPEHVQALAWLPPPPSTGEAADDKSATLLARHVPLRQQDKAGYGTRSGAVDESRVVALVKRYRTLIYIKNPILDITSLEKSARRIEEFGLDWSGESCLVLIACALALAVTPMQENHDVTGRTLHKDAFPTASLDQSASRGYYVAARKRLGLLDLSLIAAQCHYLCGIYEMCSLSVTQAWHHYQQASVSVHWLLRRVSGSEPEPSANSGLVERLYYSCVKTECEIRSEINLPSFGLAKFRMPSPLPSPPKGLLDPNRSPPAWGDLDMSHGSIEALEEAGWFYYLSEISMLRTVVRMRQKLYTHNEAWWISHIERLLHDVAELESEFDQWVRHFPAQVRTPTTELGYIVAKRAVGFKSFLFHPFLFYILNQPEDAPHWSVAAELAKRCVRLSMEYLEHVDARRWRHGGLWFHFRQLFQSVLTILAAVRSHKVPVEGDWRVAIEGALANFAVWQQESAEVRWMRVIAEGLLQDTLSRSQGGGVDIDTR